MKIDLKDAPDFFNKSKAMRAAAIRGLYSAALRGVQQIITFIIPSRSPQPVDRGIYRSGWRAAKLGGGQGAMIINSEPHAVFIEEGVRNVKIGKVALQALQEWAVRKGLCTADEAPEVAKRIAWKMRARGNIFGPQGMGILRELREKYLPEIIQQEVSREVRKALLRKEKSK